MIILATDPGTTETAWVLYDTETKLPISHAKEPNTVYRQRLRDGELQFDELAVEMIASYGMPVGREVFETCVWIGLFAEAQKATWYFIYRKDVKMHLCGTTRAKDSNVTQAIADRYAGTINKAKGTKKEPGPLYGFSYDVWAAMGVAITAAETEERNVLSAINFVG